MCSLRLPGLAASVLFLFTSNSVPAQEWGALKGRVVLDAEKAPAPVELVIDKDKRNCLAKGKIHAEQWIVHPRSLGVRNVVVWVAAEKDGKADHKAELPVHPTLKDIPADKKQVVMDQPCCKFEPHVVVLRKGQDFVGKNSSPILHSMLITGGGVDAISTSVLPRDQLVIPAARLRPHHLPATVACAIHPWMKAQLFVLSHPYFAITDADGNFEIRNVPAGKLRLMVYHEPVGYLVGDANKSLFHGKGITVEAGKVLDVGKVLVKME